MEHGKKTEESFSAWLRHEKYPAILALACAVLPLLLESGMDFLVPDKSAADSNALVWIYGLVFENPYQIANLALISGLLAYLAKSNMLLDKDGKRSVQLWEYVYHQFGEDSTLAHNTPGNLYRRISIGVKQFYFSWLAVWLVWAFLYLLKLALSVCQNEFMDAAGLEGFDFSTLTAFRLGNLLENTLNMANSFILFFIYLVITVSTVDVGDLGSGTRRNMYVGVCVFLIIWAGCFFTEICGMFSPMVPDVYVHIQFYLRLVIGITAAMSLMAVLGRLNTNFLNIPQWMMLFLYMYAAIQVADPVIYSPIVERQAAREQIVTDRELPDDGRPLPGKEAGTAAAVKRANVKGVRLEKQNLYIYAESLSPFVYFMAALGKICLFLVLCWINTRNRFLFFLIHKANTLSDSEMLLKNFNKYYEECEGTD